MTGTGKWIVHNDADRQGPWRFSDEPRSVTRKSNMHS
ncbi:hypothetical protein AVEN_147059-1, partial [Araneus ventricosus]